MKKLLIGLDLDGVCYQFDKTARYMLRTRIAARGESFPNQLYYPSTDWDYIERFVSPADWKWLWTDGVREGLFRYGHAVTGSLEGVQALVRLGDVVAITHRPPGAVHDTLAWVNLMFDKAPLSGLIIQSNGQKKSCVTPTPDIYIDDATHNADDIIDNTNADVILFDQPWNQEYPDLHRASQAGRFSRAYGWGEVIEIVRKLADA